MRYYQQPDQDFGGGGLDEDPDAPRRRPTNAPQQGGSTGARSTRAPAPAPQAPQTFAQMQQAGYARPPMPTPRPASPATGGMGGAFLMMEPPAPSAPTPQSPQTAVPAPAGSIAPISPGMMPSAPTPGAPAGAPPAGAPNGAPNFDPMEWFRQQVLGGSQNVLDRSMNYLGSQIDDDYDLREQRLREEMAARGLGDSTVYGGRMQDLNVARRSARTDLGERLALDDMNRRMGLVGSMIGLGQQGFENDFRTAQFNAAQDADYRNYLMQMLGFGYGG